MLLPNGKLLVAIDDNQLRTMASMSVDLIDWPLPPTIMGSTPCAPRAQYESVQPQTVIDPVTFSIRGHHLSAYGHHARVYMLLLSMYVLLSNVNEINDTYSLEKVALPPQYYCHLNNIATSIPFQGVGGNRLLICKCALHLRTAPVGYWPDQERLR